MLSSSYLNYDNFNKISLKVLIKKTTHIERPFIIFFDDPTANGG